MQHMSDCKAGEYSPTKAVIEFEGRALEYSRKGGSVSKSAKPGSPPQLVLPYTSYVFDAG